jgi:hypothetical protein
MKKLIIRAPLVHWTEAALAAMEFVTRYDNSPAEIRRGVLGGIRRHDRVYSIQRSWTSNTVTVVLQDDKS